MVHEHHVVNESEFGSCSRIRKYWEWMSAGKSTEITEAKHMIGMCVSDTNSSYVGYVRFQKLDSDLRPTIKKDPRAIRAFEKARTAVAAVTGIRALTNLTPAGQFRDTVACSAAENREARAHPFGLQRGWHLGILPSQGSIMLKIMITPKKLIK
jgi:hypothetical protein